jgi:hypothetical protein
MNIETKNKENKNEKSMILNEEEKELTILHLSQI